MLPDNALSSKLSYWAPIQKTSEIWSTPDLADKVDICAISSARQDRLNRTPHRECGPVRPGLIE